MGEKAFSDHKKRKKKTYVKESKHKITKQKKKYGEFLCSRWVVVVN